MSNAPINYYMGYLVTVRDKSTYDALNALVNSGNVIAITPRAIGAQLGIPYPYPTGDTSGAIASIKFYNPYIPGNTSNYGGTNFIIDDTTLSVQVHGSIGVVVTDAIFTWGAVLAYDGAPATTATLGITATRRWIFGREVSSFLEGGTTITDNILCRDSSRTVDGIGIPVRGNQSNRVNILQNSYRAITPSNGWERFYIRVRRLPTTVDVGIWRSHSTPSANCGWAVKVSTGGALQIVSLDNTATETVQANLMNSVDLNIWHRIDVIYQISTGAGPLSQIRGIFMLDGVTIYGPNSIATSGYGGTAWTNSDLGRWNSVGAEQECEIDLDDWIGMDIPTHLDPIQLTQLIVAGKPVPKGLDFITGSHVRLHNTVSASQTNWAAAGTAVGIENQSISQSNRLATADLTSTTSAAQLEGLTDLLDKNTLDTIANTKGVVAAVIGIYSSVATGADGQLGFRPAGGAPVLVTIDQQIALNSNSVAYLPGGLTLPTEIFPWSHVHTKSADANLDTTVAMSSVVEYLGIWGPEDNKDFSNPISRVGFLHNCRYGNTPYGYWTSQPQADCFAVGGTYTGNGTYQEISLPSACNFLWIRPLSGGVAGVKFFGAALGPGYGAKERIIPNVRMWFDLTAKLFKFGVSGNNAEVNTNATVYQYIAFCDPGMRFSLTGAFAHASGVSVPKVNTLIADTFFADCGFAQRSAINTASNTQGLYFRGTGSASHDATALDAGGNVNNIMDFASGILNSYANIHSGGSGGPQTTFMLFRMQDSGQIKCAGNVLIQTLKYTGNGGGSQVINLTPTSGRFPLFVLVAPVGAGASFMRDPSHTANNSCNVDTLVNSTTAITACAKDQITVGTALNTNALVYNVFVICGDTAGMNNGVFLTDYCDGDGPYVPPVPIPPGEIVIVGNGGLILDGTTGQTLLKDISGIYTLIPLQRHDTLYDRQTGQPNVDVEIPDPTFKTGYVGG